MSQPHEPTRIYGIMHTVVDTYRHHLVLLQRVNLSNLTLRKAKVQIKLQKESPS
jgi:hypothetical protein